MRRVGPTACLLLLAVGGGCPDPSPPSGDAGVDAGSDAGDPPGISASGVELSFVIENAGRVEWLALPTGTLAFDRNGADGCADVLTVGVDGTGLTCLTCDHPDAPDPMTGYGNPVGHPSGRYLVMQGEKAVHDGARCGLGTGPGTGAFNDLVVLDRSQNTISTLVVSPGCPNCGATQPQFSHDGARLAWVEVSAGGNVFVDGQEFGFSRIMVADVTELPTGGLALANVVALEPNGTRWYASPSFSPEGSSLVFTSSEAGLDVPTNAHLYSRRFADGHVEQLTDGGFEDQGHFAADGRIAFAGGPDVLHTEWWLLEGGGGGPRVLSRFNEVGSKDWMAGDLAWSPAGGVFAGFVNSGFSAGGFEGLIYRAQP